MKGIFSFHLINSPFEDTIIYAQQLNAKDDILFDLGDTKNFAPTLMLRIRWVFITHTHMDHFFGFHNFFRTILKIIGKRVDFFGPKDLAKNIHGALHSYHWNLLEGYDISFCVHEIHNDKIEVFQIDSATQFKLEKIDEKPFNPVVFDHSAFFIQTDIFDHKIPVLGFRIQEKDRFGVDKEKLKAHNLKSGPWIGKAKNIILDETGNLNEKIEISSGLYMSVKEIKSKIFIKKETLSYAYLTDFLVNDEAFEKAVSLAKGVKTLFIEAQFLHDDLDLAIDTHHLTAYQAGQIAKAAGAYQIKLIHHSSRYQKEIQNDQTPFMKEMEQGRSDSSK